MRAEKEIEAMYKKMLSSYKPYFNSNEIIQESGSVYRRYVAILEWVLGYTDDDEIDEL